MGVRPKESGNFQIPVPSSAQSEVDSLKAEMEQEIAPATNAIADIGATSESANTAAAEAAAAIAALEKQPLLLWWNGTGTPPPLKPGWALYNTATGKVTF